MYSFVRVMICCFVVAFGFAPQTVFAAEEAKAVPAATIDDTPIAIEKRHTPVAVEYEGNDSIGASLSMSVKERFNTSSLFSLSEKDVPKIRLLLATVPEFPSRPGVGSAYSAVWVFSQSESTLRHFLQTELGVLTQNDVQELSAKLIEITDRLAVKYSYLFQN